MMTEEELKLRSVEVATQREELIQEHGWMIQGVFPREGEEGASFSYTIGLSDKGFPELVIYSIPAQAAQGILNTLAERVVENNAPFIDGDIIDDVLIGGLPLTIADVTKEHECYQAQYRLDPGELKVQQVVWPDQDGKFVWEGGFDYGETQPLLFDVEGK